MIARCENYPFTADKELRDKDVEGEGEDADVCILLLCVSGHKACGASPSGALLAQHALSCRQAYMPTTVLSAIAYKTTVARGVKNADPYVQ